MFKSGIFHHTETIKMFSSEAEKYRNNSFEDTNSCWMKLVSAFKECASNTVPRAQTGLSLQSLNNPKGHLTKVAAVLGIFQSPQILVVHLDVKEMRLLPNTRVLTDVLQCAPNTQWVDVFWHM